MTSATRSSSPSSPARPRAPAWASLSFGASWSSTTARSRCIPTRAVAQCSAPRSPRSDMARILVADDEPGLREFIVDSLELDEHTVVPARDGREAAKLLDERGFDLVLTDLKMPGLDGMQLLRKVRAEQPEVEVIVMTAHGSVENAVEAMKLGAFEYLQKPISGPDELRLLVARAVERRGLKDRVDGSERLVVEPAGPPLTYGDPAMRPVVEAIE